MGEVGWWISLLRDLMVPAALILVAILSLKVHVREPASVSAGITTQNGACLCSHQETLNTIQKCTSVPSQKL